LQRPFDIERADQAIFAGAKRQAHQLPLGQQFGKRACGRRFGGPARAAYEHAAETRIDGRQQQRLL